MTRAREADEEGADLMGGTRRQGRIVVVSDAVINRENSTVKPVLATTIETPFMSFLGVTVDRDPSSPPTVVGIVAFMLFFAIQINLCLIVFNLIPLYPLDGHHVLREMLPARMHTDFMEWQRRFGRYLLLGLLLGPWLLRSFRLAVTFNPIGRLLSFVIETVMPVLLPDRAALLGFSAWVRYVPYLPY